MFIVTIIKSLIMICQLLINQWCEFGGGTVRLLNQQKMKGVFGKSVIIIIIIILLFYLVPQKLHTSPLSIKHFHIKLYLCKCNRSDVWFQFPDAAGYVGFANLPNQVHRKSVKKGFEFTLMVVGEEHINTHIDLDRHCAFNLVLFVILGESGLGKSTLINSLFLTDLYPERYIPGAAGKTHTHTALLRSSTLQDIVSKTEMIPSSHEKSLFR